MAATRDVSGSCIIIIIIITTEGASCAFCFNAMPTRSAAYDLWVVKFSQDSMQTKYSFTASIGRK